MQKSLMLLVLAVGVSLTACSKPARPNESKTAELSPRPADEAAAPSIDACTVVSAEEIGSLFGQPVQGEPKKLEAAEGGFRVSQCRITLQDNAGIIDLRIVLKGAGPGARDPKEAWQETFSREQLDQTKAQPQATKWMPEEIPGLGEAAYWRGETKESSLYALKGSAYIRITLFSREAKEEKLRKCTALAQSVLKQL